MSIDRFSADLFASGWRLMYIISIINIDELRKKEYGNETDKSIDDD